MYLFLRSKHRLVCNEYILQNPQSLGHHQLVKSQNWSNQHSTLQFHNLNRCSQNVSKHYFFGLFCKVHATFSKTTLNVLKKHKCSFSSFGMEDILSSWSKGKQAKILLFSWSKWRQSKTPLDSRQILAKWTSAIEIAARIGILQNPLPDKDQNSLYIRCWIRNFKFENRSAWHFY